MDSAAWKRIVGPLLDDDWALKGKVVYLRPVGWVLHGVLWEPSASRPGFYLWRLQMPLYQPVTVIDLSWSERHGGGSRVYDPTDALTRAAVAEAMVMVRADYDKAAVVIDLPGGVDNVGIMEVRAYGLLLEGNHVGAAEILDRVSRYEAKYPWQEQMVRRAESMWSMIQGSYGREALQQLAEWRAESLAILEIDTESRA